jgi:hypothetical protein
LAKPVRIVIVAQHGHADFPMVTELTLPRLKGHASSIAEANAFYNQAANRKSP